jgi:hypothetical protein
MMGSGLRELLRRSDAETMRTNARITASAPEGTERRQEAERQEAERQVHQAMYRAALGEITEEERSFVLAVLYPCCPELFIARPQWTTPWRSRTSIQPCPTARRPCDGFNET